MAKNIPVGPGTQVTLTFELSLASGEHVDGTGGKPATFVVGDGSLLPGFERAMFGMLAGESAVLAIQPEDGFGAPNPENVHVLKRSDFGRDMELTPGLVVSFSDPERQELPGVVSRVFGDSVEVDFNHPLAGLDLTFEVSIMDVEQVSQEIVRM